MRCCIQRALQASPVRTLVADRGVLINAQPFLEQDKVASRHRLATHLRLKRLGLAPQAFTPSYTTLLCTFHPLAASGKDPGLSPPCRAGCADQASSVKHQSYLFLGPLPRATHSLQTNRHSSQRGAGLPPWLYFSTAWIFGTPPARCVHRACPSASFLYPRCSARERLGPRHIPTQASARDNSLGTPRPKSPRGPHNTTPHYTTQHIDPGASGLKRISSMSRGSRRGGISWGWPHGRTFFDRRVSRSPCRFNQDRHKCFVMQRSCRGLVAI